jgi:DNA-binding LytR/AlgR family response regulator
MAHSAAVKLPNAYNSGIFTHLKTLEGGQDIDLLFSDVVMPGGINGRQLADEAVRKRPGLKVLFTTGYTRNALFITGAWTPAFT